MSPEEIKEEERKLEALRKADQANANYWRKKIGHRIKDRRPIGGEGSSHVHLTTKAARGVDSANTAAMRGIKPINIYPKPSIARGFEMMEDRYHDERYPADY